MDKDSNGALTFDETIKILRGLNIGFTKEDIKEKFQVIFLKLALMTD